LSNELEPLGIVSGKTSNDWRIYIEYTDELAMIEERNNQF